MSQTVVYAYPASYGNLSSIKDANGGNLTPEAKSLLEESIANLTKIKEKDPNRETINWAYILYQAYYLIGNEEEAKKLESLIQ